MKIDLEFVSNPTNISYVEKLLQQVTKRVRINDETYANMHIALTEAVNNAMLHGNRCDQSKIVKIETYIDTPTGTVEFEVSDEGIGFDDSLVPDPTLPENIAQPGGRGVFLMQQLCDRLRYVNKGRTARLTFNKQSTNH